jgi:hypothetical protein
MKGHKLYAAETNKGLTAFTSKEMVLIDEAAANVVGYYAQADDETQSKGTAWYSEKAAALAHEVAAQTGIEFETAAAVVAVCSPRTRWAQQVNRTADFVNYVLEYRDLTEAPKCSLYWGAMEKAAMGLLYGDWSGLNTPKVGPFYRNIIGDDTVVTLDVWAIRAGLGQPSAPEAVIEKWAKGRPRLILEAAYHKAAEVIGAPVAAVQAVVWVVVRGSAD